MRSKNNTYFINNRKIDYKTRWLKQKQFKIFKELKNNCFLTKRKRAVLNDFGLSRISFRLLASKNQLPGISKASW
jgi:ribosomal protein S14